MAFCIFMFSVFHTSVCLSQSNVLYYSCYQRCSLFSPNKNFQISQNKTRENFTLNMVKIPNNYPPIFISVESDSGKIGFVTRFVDSTYETTPKNWVCVVDGFSSSQIKMVTCNESWPSLSFMTQKDKWMSVDCASKDEKRKIICLALGKTPIYPLVAVVILILTLIIFGLEFLRSPSCRNPPHGNFKNNIYPKREKKNKLFLN